MYNDLTLWAWMGPLLAVAILGILWWWISTELYPRWHLWREDKRPVGKRCLMCRIEDSESKYSPIKRRT